MKKLLYLSFCALPFSGFAHGPGHIHSGESEVARALDETVPEVAEKRGLDWGAALTAGWESEHVHYGVNESAGTFTTELGVWVDDFLFSAWSGFGTGTDFQEWNFTAAYRVDVGPVFLTPGYNLRFTPSFHEDEHHDEHEEHEGHDEQEEHEEHDEHEGHEGHEHAHRTFGNEIFLILGTDRLPYVTPTVNVITDLNNVPGTFLEFRVDGDIPLYKDILRLQPYALLGLNFGYNTRDYYGWNNFQFGLQATWKIHRNISVFGGVNYSVAMAALREIGQGNEVWANTGVTFSF